MSRKDVTKLIEKLADSRLRLKETFEEDGDEELRLHYRGEWMAMDTVLRILKDPKFAQTVWNTWMT